MQAIKTAVIFAYPMLRGQKALMAIISNDLKITSTKHVKGCFTDDRDNALASRFYYHSHLLGLRFDLCLAILSKEFFLSETVISQRLMTRQVYLKQMRLDLITRNHLKKNYPFFNWF